MRVISLSSIPPRFHMLGPVLRSLLDQRCQIDAIHLYLPTHYRRFPGYDGTLPEVPDGVTIVRGEADLGPASKVLFAVRDFSGTPAQILFCDDDKIFPRQWARSLFEAQAERPGECVAMSGQHLTAFGVRHVGTRQPRARQRSGGIDLDYRMRRLARQAGSLILGKTLAKPMRRSFEQAGYVDILHGFGGVVVRPDFFDETAYDIPDILWTVDDFWLSGMLARRDIPVWLPSRLEKPAPTRADDVDSLTLATIDGADRHEANLSCVAYMQQHFGIWREAD